MEIHEWGISNNNNAMHSLRLALDAMIKGRLLHHRLIIVFVHQMMMTMSVEDLIAMGN